MSGRLLPALRDADDESYALCCEALAEYDVRDCLAAIASPVLALWGEYDVVAPETKAAEIATGVPGGRSVRIDVAAAPTAGGAARRDGTGAHLLLDEWNGMKS